MNETLGALLALLSVYAMGCSSNGHYTPFTEGSQLKESRTEDAELAVGYDAPNGIFHEPRYDLTISFKEGRRQKIKFGFIMDGQFSSPDKDTARLSCSTKDGMTIETDDILLKSLADHITLTLKYAPEMTYNKQFRKIDHAYAFELQLFDADNRLLGRYEDKLLDHSETQLLGAEGLGPKPAANGNPMSASAIFSWMQLHARWSSQ